jgi:hypothetical protein
LSTGVSVDVARWPAKLHERFWSTKMESLFPELRSTSREKTLSLVDANSVLARTDVGGRFDFGPKLKHGVYEIYARKDEDGYPDPTSKFYQPLNSSRQDVQLFGDQPAEKVGVQLTEKAATVVGRVFDADTGRPLKAVVGFTNLRTEADHSVSADGKFYALIPANKDVFVFVEVGV